ncbi:hypothetical protein GGI05_004899, partial [Coemansia sp. RSA 2603]
YLPTGRQTQQQHMFQEQQQPQQRQATGLAYRLGGSRSGIDLRSMAAQESDDIDDILCNLWPTSRGEPCAMGGSPFLMLAHSMAPAQHTWQRPADGQHTPPDDTSGHALSAMLVQRSHPLASPMHASKDAGGAYSVVATGSPTQTAYPMHVRAMDGRPVSSAIQIGDPEWRVDSPQSMRTVSPQLLPLSTGSSRLAHGGGMGKMPSPTSPAGGWQSPGPLDGVDEPLGRGQATALGLGHVGRARPSRCATLGPQHLGRRLVTPEERAARLSAVSGLAARAVARRCLSGQIPQVDAGLMLRQAATPHATAADRKPTFADIARGTHD